MAVEVDLNLQREPSLHAHVDEAQLAIVRGSTLTITPLCPGVSEVPLVPPFVEARLATLQPLATLCACTAIACGARSRPLTSKIIGVGHMQAVSIPGPLTDDSLEAPADAEPPAPGRRRARILP